MSLPGPILIVSDHPDRKLAAAFAAAGAVPVVETVLSEAAKAIARINPAAVLFADPDCEPTPLIADELAATIDAMPAPFMPVAARVDDCGATRLDALPIGVGAPNEQIVARLAAALRVRTLHAVVLRRIDTLRSNGADVPMLPDSDPLADATVLVTGRGRHYPALTSAVEERVGLIGALSVEAAARYLNTRDVDGIIVGEGFGPSTVKAFLTALSEDSRFRDLPVGVVPDVPAPIDRARLPGLEPISGTPDDMVAHLMPLVRVHAFGARLRRHVASLDARGMIDPHTGLFTVAAFERDLPRAITDAHQRNIPMSIARFELPVGLSRRAQVDAARLVSRLIRAADFACQGENGAITVVMTESALYHSHVIARRIASVIRQAMLDGERRDGSPLEAMVTLASLKSTDSPQSLLARVSAPATTAAE
ncbi:MAG TPA: GGDEF domain-containing protein [Xanthobacteraceae bacterium]|nr:GGDEF domain-containing protein [Xanthobacteraceae bacterium]